MDFLNSTNPDVPDGADLIDEIGMALDRSDWFNVADKIPFIQEFVTALQTEAIFDLQVGIVSDKGLIAAHVKTDGIDDLYKKIVEGAQ